MALQSLDITVMAPDLTPIGMLEAGVNESFIWTDRYATPGECKFKGPAGSKNLNLLQPGNILSISHSPRLMMIEDHLNQTHREQGATLTINAKGIENFLINRFVPNGYTAGKNTIPTLIYNLLSKVCVAGAGSSPNDIIPNLIVPESGSGVMAEVDFTAGSNLLSVFQELANSANMGLKVTYSEVTKKLFFEVYSGSELDITFSPAMGTLIDESYFLAITDHYNVAYVRSDTHNIFVGPGVNLTGFNRRVLYVDGSGINVTTANWQDKFTQKGLEELAKRKKKSIFDGTVDPDGVYQYGRDYNLGDIVTISDTWGHSSKARVAEFIWSHDSQGIQSYPSFTAVNPEES